MTIWEQILPALEAIDINDHSTLDKPLNGGGVDSGSSDRYNISDDDDDDQELVMSQ